MKRAAAIVTNRGGRTCHAAIIARELGIPAVVGCGDATRVLARRRAGHRLAAPRATPATSTRACSTSRSSTSRSTGCRRAPTKIMMNVGNPGARVRVPPAAQRGRGPRAARVHHQPQRRHPPEGAARARPPAAPSCSARSSARIGGYASPTEFYVQQDRRGRGDDRRGVLAEEGDRAAVRLQVERVLEPRRRRALRAARGEPDARLPRRVALHRAGVPRLLRARVRGDEARARRRWASPTSS